eukprot:TRINITY_DN19118_c0_g1_i1.p1 TRINITY_DN19118_c0_g1~~TRINITY_DN19118_c0_g1_i1.p1  ORF type:complete len:332 (+),score=84.45 TRINITY_DN19118_c0_g1_i1:37-1032(+)
MTSRHPCHGAEAGILEEAAIHSPEKGCSWSSSIAREMRMTATPPVMTTAAPLKLPDEALKRQPHEELGLFASTQSRALLRLTDEALKQQWGKLSPAESAAPLRLPDEALRRLAAAESVMEPSSPGEASGASSPGEVVVFNDSSSSSSGSTEARAVELERLRAAAATAMQASCQEIAALRAENAALQQSRTTLQAQALRLRSENISLRQGRAALQTQALRLQGQLEAQQAEIVALRRRQAERARDPVEEARCDWPGQENRAPAGLNSFALASEEMLARQLAQMETAALADLAGEERARLRRQLQLKWHPDKNSHNAAFATRVLQELHRQGDW